MKRDQTFLAEMVSQSKLLDTPADLVLKDGEIVERVLKHGEIAERVLKQGEIAERVF